MREPVSVSETTMRSPVEIGPLTSPDGGVVLADAYATTKDRRANKIIEDKGLNIGFRAITFGTYGAFGKSTHKLIATATANSPQPLFSPWVKPGPKAHAYLLFGFTLARANARMLINAEAKRRSARNSVRASRPQSTSAVAVLG